MKRKVMVPLLVILYGWSVSNLAVRHDIRRRESDTDTKTTPKGHTNDKNSKGKISQGNISSPCSDKSRPPQAVRVNPSL
jgi:hypothetical protein